MKKIEKIIDSLMNIGYKTLCFLCAIIVAISCVSSCSIKAKAISPVDATEWAQDAAEYLEAVKEESKRVIRTFNNDLNSGNFDATTDIGKNKLRVFLLQELFRNNKVMSDISKAVQDALDTVPNYDKVDALPDSSVVSGGGLCGIYTSYKDNLQHVANAFRDVTNGGVMVQSDEFYVSVLLTQKPAPGDFVSSGSLCGFSYNARYDSYYRQTKLLISDTSNYFNTSYTLSISPPATDGRYVTFNGSAVVPLPASLLSSYSSTNTLNFGGYQIAASLPEEGVMDYYEIWNYYNNYLLPYILQNYYFDGIDQYLYFPNGYGNNNIYFPNAGINIDIDNNYNYNIQIEYQTVTDESGEPVTDESGETQTETIIVTDTRPTDAVYNFTMPTLPHLNEYTETPPNINLSEYSDGINFIFAATTGIFTDTGFLPVVVICLSLGVFCYIIWKVGG